jgi:hypothetical protein
MEHTVSRKTKPLQSCRQLPVFVAISTGQKLPKAKPASSQEPQCPDGAPPSLLARTTATCITLEPAAVSSICSTSFPTAYDSGHH